MILKEYPFKLDKVEDNIITFVDQFKDKNNLKVKVFVLEKDIIRVMFIRDKLTMEKTWMVAPNLADVPYQGRNKFDVSPFSLPKYNYYQKEGSFVVETERLRAKIDLDGFKVTWYARQGNDWVKIAADRKTQSYNLNQHFGSGIYHYLEKAENDKYYGLGEKAGEIEKNDNRYRMTTIDAMGYDAEKSDPLYKYIPFYITRNTESEISYGLFYDNLSEAVFDFAREKDNYHGHYRYYFAESGDLDYYMILGPEMKAVTRKFSWLSGENIFEPKWSLGYSGSTMTYTDSPNAQEELMKFIADCDRHDIPCDSFQLSSGYTSIDDKRYVFNWNYSKIPDPEKMSATFNKNGIKLCANIKPCLLIDHPRYEEAKEKNLFIKNEKGEVEVSQFWDNLGSYLDFTNQDTVDWWKDNVKNQLLEFGIDSTWNDNNEYEIWSDDAYANGFGSKINMNLIRPLQSLLMMKSSFEAQKEHAPNKRPYLISRSGCPGMERYVQTWSGDNYTSWKTLKYNIKMGLGLTMSGVYNFGHDVGGFAGPAPEPELLVRWVQNGVFYPRFTIHSWNDDQSVNTPWMYQESVDSIRKAIKFREKIKPYLYNLLYESHINHTPIIKPTFYEFDEHKAYKQDLEFMLGEYMLVANVVEKGAEKRKLYLPGDTSWYEYNTNKIYQGGEEIIVDVSLDTIPLFIKEGAIIPIQDQEISFANHKKEKRAFMIYPFLDSGKEEYTLFEDDGESYNYLDGEYKKIKIEMKSDPAKIVLQLTSRGNYKLPYQEIKIYFPEFEERNIIINNESVDLDQNHSTTLVLE
ncbi:alpha-glucosidase [Halanaerobium saccharolyticum]|jgi:alpha-glucosidase|uniref:Alpha-glucosidase n=1 Tax=Halanaerobium saccharolyticum TaxID=43595 RepID=A0A2T5RLL8_9FIRM|nr:glycoside hydrolase family 31 protein [Halanaerobium saccharolyticum]PTW00138.1 alpha-glucosidase [Halanaerobium saccharolyticum]TDP93601.1 alpha-glucosidase [Halanaerobium saccharolyticum]